MIAEHDEQSEERSLAELTTDIVSAYVSHNQIAPSDLAKLVSAVASGLGKVGTKVAPAEETKPQPVVPVRRSISPDYLVCLVCGKKQKLLNLTVEHGLTPAQYRVSFGLKRDYPMAAPNYTQRRRELALKIGLGRPKKPERRQRKKSTAEPSRAEVGR